MGRPKGVEKEMIRVRLPLDVIGRLDEMCEEHGMSQAEMIEELIMETLEESEAPPATIPRPPQKTYVTRDLRADLLAMVPASGVKFWTELRKEFEPLWKNCQYKDCDIPTEIFKKLVKDLNQDGFYFDLRTGYLAKDLCELDKFYAENPECDPVLIERKKAEAALRVEQEAKSVKPAQEVESFPCL